MIFHRLLIAITLPILLMSGTLARAEDSASAKKFILEVYADYTNPDISHQQQRQRNFYSPQLYRLILADSTAHPGEIGNLDNDPICDCQDPGDPGDLKVRSIRFSKAGPSRIRATVDFVIVTTPRTVVLLLLETPSGWRIDDISTTGMPSLRRLLRGTE